MAWFFGKKKEEPVQDTKVLQTENEMTKTAQNYIFPERDKKTLKRMLNDAVMINMEFNKPRPPRLSKEQVMTAALGFYLNGDDVRSSRYMKDLAFHREKLGEWTYYAINLFAFGVGFSSEKNPDIAGDLRVRLIAEEPSYKVQPGDILGVTSDINGSIKQPANIFINKDALLKAMRLRLVAAKKVAESYGDSEEGFTFKEDISDAYLYQAVVDLAESNLWVSHPSKNKNYYPEKLQKQEDNPVALYWLHQCSLCGLLPEDSDTFDSLKKSADAGYTPAIYQLYADYRDKLSQDEKAELETQMAEYQSMYIDYLLQLDEDEIESFSAYEEQIIAERNAASDKEEAELIYQKSINVDDEDSVVCDMLRAATMGNADAYKWVEAYAFKKRVPAALAAEAGRLYETYQKTKVIDRLNESKELYEEARAGGSGEASYQLWLHYKDFYSEHGLRELAFWESLLKEAVGRRYLPAYADYIEIQNPDYRILKFMSDRAEEALKTGPLFIQKWHAMNAWRNIALSKKADLPLASFALAGFCKLYLGNQIIGSTDYHVVNFNHFSPLSEKQPAEVNGSVAANCAVSSDPDVKASVGELFRDDPKGLLSNLKEREELVQLWFRLAEQFYLLQANSGSSYDAARLCRLYALDIKDYDKVEEWMSKTAELKSLYNDIVLWECREIFDKGKDFFDIRIYELKNLYGDLGKSVGTKLENYINCDDGRRSLKWTYAKGILIDEQAYAKRLSANGKYDVKVTPLDPEGLEIKKKIVSGLQRIPEGFTEEEQLHIHDAEYIKEKHLELQHLYVLEGVRELLEENEEDD